MDNFQDLAYSEYVCMYNSKIFVKDKKKLSQILMKMALLFYKIFSLEVNRLSHSSEPILKAIFSLRSEYFQGSNSFLRRCNPLASHFIFDLRKQQQIIRCQMRGVTRITHSFGFLSAQKLSCMSRYVRARIVLMKDDSSSTVGFAQFP